MKTQLLLDLIKANEAAENFNLGRWIEHCGTYGCLVGNHACAVGGEFLSVASSFCDGDASTTFSILASKYGVTIRESFFLFASQNNTICWDAGSGENIYSTTYRLRTDKQKAINRVRKYLYYKLHKQELMEDPKVRHMEGDHHVVRKAAERAVCMA